MLGDEEGKGEKKWTKDTSGMMVNKNVSGNVERKAELRRRGLTDMTFFHCGLASRQGTEGGFVS